MVAQSQWCASHIPPPLSCRNGRQPQIVTEVLLPSLLIARFLTPPTLLFYPESFQLVLSLAALTSALSVALVLGVTRFVNGIRYSVIEAPRSLIEPEKEITKRALAVFATFSVALLSINTTSHSASDLAPVHVILIIPFVVDEVIVAIIPAIPSLLHTLHIWFRRLSTELKVISGLGNREACSPDDIGFAIVSIDRIPINVTGHFNDIFLGRHVSFGQVALRRPRISEGNYRDTMRVRTECGMHFTAADLYPTEVPKRN